MGNEICLKEKAGSKNALICPICVDTMTEPVINLAKITYCRQCIKVSYKLYVVVVTMLKKQFGVYKFCYYAITHYNYRLGMINN